MFQPSRHSYGSIAYYPYGSTPIQEAASEVMPQGVAPGRAPVPMPEQEEGYDTEALVAEYAPLVKTGLEQVLDPTQQVEVLRARVKNTKKAMNALPSILQGPLRARLRVLQAKLKAAERRVALQREQESARRTWRTLGQIAVVSGVVVAIAVTARILR